MKTIVALLIVVLTFSGCAETFKRLEQEQAQRKINEAAEKDATIKKIVNSQVNSWFLCKGKEQCEKAFKLTKLYIMQNSDYKISSSDELYISTHAYNIYNMDIAYQARFEELIYMTAIKIPLKGEVGIEKIMITADCGKYHNPSIKETPKCIDEVIKIYDGFIPFMASQL